MPGSSGKPTNGIKAPYFDGSQVCAQVDPELFFPETPADSIINMRFIRPICGSCAFKDPCLDYALNDPELQGVWAGTTVRDRQILRRNIKRKANMRKPALLK